MPLCVIAQPIHEAGVAALRAAGVDVRVADAPDLDTLAAQIGPAQAVLIRDALPAWVMDEAPDLKVIANHGTGTDAVDVAHATARGIPVVYTPQSNVQAVAEHALMLMLATARKAAAADAATRSADWGFKYRYDLFSLWGKTLGIIGYGHTGRWLAAVWACACASGRRVHRPVRSMASNGWIPCASCSKAPMWSACTGRCVPIRGTRWMRSRWPGCVPTRWSSTRHAAG